MSVGLDISTAIMYLESAKRDLKIMQDTIGISDDLSEEQQELNDDLWVRYDEAVDDIDSVLDSLYLLDDIE